MTRDEALARFAVIASTKHSALHVSDQDREALRMMLDEVIQREAATVWAVEVGSEHERERVVELCATEELARAAAVDEQSRDNDSPAHWTERQRNEWHHRYGHWMTVTEWPVRTGKP